MEFLVDTMVFDLHQRIPEKPKASPMVWGIDKRWVIIGMLGQSPMFIVADDDRETATNQAELFIRTYYVELLVSWGIDFTMAVAIIENAMADDVEEGRLWR